MMSIAVRCVFFVPFVLLTACAPKMVKMYDGPDLDKSKKAVVKGANDRIQIAKVDWKKTSLNLLNGYPNEVHVLPGNRSVFVAYDSGPALMWSGDSLIEFNAEHGQEYFVNNRFWGKTLFFWLEDSNGNYIYKKDDLISTIDEIVKQYNMSFYKLDSKKHTDYFISFVRQGAFKYPWADKSAVVLIGFGLLNDSDFNCDQFYSKLTDDQKKDFNKKMNDYPFICKNKNYTEKEAREAFKELLNEQITTPEIADAHWAWFSATGKNDILKRILDNYLYVSSSCKDCIEWSYKSIASQNKDVENYLIEYMNGKSSSEVDKLRVLLPSQKSAK